MAFTSIVVLGNDKVSAQSRCPRASNLASYFGAKVSTLGLESVLDEAVVGQRSNVDFSVEYGEVPRHIHHTNLRIVQNQAPGQRPAPFSQTESLTEGVIDADDKEEREVKARIIDSRICKILALKCRFFDLAVIGSHMQAAEPINTIGHIGSSLANALPCPLLVLPDDLALSHKSMNRPLLCWDGSNECKRVFKDALPLLQRADKLQVIDLRANQNLSDRRRQQLKPEADELKLYLQANGIEASIHSPTIKPTEQGEYLQTQFNSGQYNLVIAPAYSHSKLRDLAMGRSLKEGLFDCKQPLFLSS